MNIYDLEKKSTEGPWAVDDGGDGEVEIWAIESGMTCPVCIVTDHCEPTEQDHANAAIIVHKCNHFMEALEALKVARRNGYNETLVSGEYFAEIIKKLETVE